MNPSMDTEASAPEPENAKTPRVFHRLVALVAAVQTWAGVSRRRMLATAVAAAATLIGAFTGWNYVANLAIENKNAVTLEMALAALDQEKYEVAEMLANQLQRQRRLASNVGGMLYVLGSVKAHQADLEWSDERRRATRLVAARYLENARSYGIPEDRESDALFLLGQSLVIGNQPLEAIEFLREALQDENLPPAGVHQLLSEAYLNLPDPNWEEALRHIQAVAKISELADEPLEQGSLADAQLTEIEIQLQVGNLDEAEAKLQSLGDGTADSPRAKNLVSQWKLHVASRLDEDDPQRKQLLEESLEDLRAVQQQEDHLSESSRRAMYLIGKCLEYQGDPYAAIEQYDRVVGLHGDTAESVLATLSKAELIQAGDRPELALASFRAVLESVGDPNTYGNRLLPLAEFKKRLVHAHTQFVVNQQFEQAEAMLDHFSPLFSVVEVAELKGATHLTWAAAKIDEALDVGSKATAESLNRSARYHYRAAGRAYETLAELRFATHAYIDDLWTAAESYYQGQSYTHATRILDLYLRHEARSRRALALLREGQSLLATGKLERAIESLEECIELHPRDPSIFQARIECAKAHLQMNEPEKAERLLLLNLAGDTLTPKSIEWRDSLFMLGDHLHESGRYAEAIEKLEEAVMRYPEAPQALLARYTIARSFHSAAEEHARLAVDAQTDSERQKNRRQRDHDLEQALTNYAKVQRTITLSGFADEFPLTRALIRNCYLMQGSVLYQLRRYDEAREMYANVATLYQNEPLVLESFVNIANCWHRLNQPLNARQTIAQARIVLNRLPEETDFKQTTNFSQNQWDLILAEMANW